MEPDDSGEAEDVKRDYLLFPGKDLKTMMMRKTD